MLFKVCAFLLLSTLSSGVFAQANIIAAQVNASKVRFSGTATLGYSSNMYERTAVESKTSLEGNLLLNYRVVGSHLVRAYIGGEKETTQGRESKLSDGYVGWLNNTFWRQGEVLTIGQQVRAILPTSRESRQRDYKNLGVSVIPSFMFNMTPVGLTGVTFIYQPQFIKNFHQYKQNRLYKNNVEYSIQQAAILNYSVTDSLYLQPSLVYGNSWSYDRVKKDDSFQFNIETGYSIRPELILALGTNNTGKIQNFENGNDQTIELYDKDTATVYSALYYVF